MHSFFRRASRLSLLLNVVALGTLPAYSYQQAAPNRVSTPANVRARVTALRHSIATDHIRVVIQFDTAVQYQPGTAVNPDRIFFDLSSTEPATTLPTKTFVGDPILQRIRVAPYQPGITRVVLDISKPVSYNSSFVADPPRLVIDLARSAVNDPVPAPVSPASLTSSNGAAEKHLRMHDGQLLPTQSRPAGRSSAVRKNLNAAAPVPARSRADSVAATQAIRVAASPSAIIAGTKPLSTQALLVSANQPSAVVRGSPPPTPPKALDARDSQLVQQFGGKGKPAVGSAEWCLKAAQQGSIDAQFQLGNLYVNGDGVPHDLTEAARWYTHAAQQGHAAAASNLGVLYANGWGVGKDDAEAVKWFRKASDAGDDGGRANLGAMYLKGRGVVQSDVEGARWLRAAAEHGVPEAQYGLGTLFANGRGLPRSEAETAKWLQKAADQGYAPARLAVGKLHVAGAGVSRDYHSAMKYFQQANTPEAWYQIGLLYQEGLGVPRNDAQAMTWFLKAARHKLPDAQYAIGQAYQNRDPIEAYSWFALAASNGHQQGIIAMNSLAPHMTAAQLREAQTRALNKAAHASN